MIRECFKLKEIKIKSSQIFNNWAYMFDQLLSFYSVYHSAYFIIRKIILIIAEKETISAFCFRLR